MKKNGNQIKFADLNYYFEHAKVISNFDKKISFVIFKFLLERDYLKYKPQIDNLKLNVDFNKLKASEISSLEDFTNFIGSLFEKADKEEKSGKFSYQTACVFRIIVDLINLIEIWKPIEEEKEWQKLRKYCKFKVIEIVNSLQNKENQQIQKSDLDDNILNFEDFNNGNLSIKNTDNKNEIEREIDEELNQLIRETEKENKINKQNSLSNNQEIQNGNNKFKKSNSGLTNNSNTVDEKNHRSSSTTPMTKKLHVRQTSQVPIKHVGVIEGINALQNETKPVIQPLQIKTIGTNIENNQANSPENLNKLIKSNNSKQVFMDINNLQDYYKYKQKLQDNKNNVNTFGNTFTSNNMNNIANQKMINVSPQQNNNNNQNSFTNYNPNFTNKSNFYQNPDPRNNYSSNKPLSVNPLSSNDFTNYKLQSQMSLRQSYNPVFINQAKDKDYSDLSKAISELKNSKIQHTSKVIEKPNIDIKENVINPVNNENKQNLQRSQSIINQTARVNQVLPLKTIMISPNYKPTVKNNFKLPIKLRSPDYFNVISTIKKILDSSTKDLDSNKIDKTHQGLENALYYLTKIE